MPNQTMIIRRSSRQQAARIACLVPMNTVRFSGRCMSVMGVCSFMCIGHAVSGMLLAMCQS